MEKLLFVLRKKISFPCRTLVSHDYDLFLREFTVIKKIQLSECEILSLCSEMCWSQESKGVQKIHFVVSVWNLFEAAECNLNRAAFIDLGFSSLEWRRVCEKRWRSMYWQRTVWFVIKSIRRNGRKEKGARGFMDVVKKDMKLVGVRRGCRAEGLMEAGDSLWSPLKGTAQRRNFSKNLMCWFWKIAKINN